MKTKSIYYTLYLLTFCLLASCGSQMSFSRKHYNKRYYIDMSKAESVPSVESENPMDGAQDDEKEKITDKPLTIPVANVKSPEYLSATIKEDNIKHEKGSMASLHKTRGNHRIAGFLISDQHNGKVISADEKVQTPSEGDALSFFWIIIVIILAVWLIGFILGGLGTGGAIHILLIVALILLILWLLGII